MTIASKQKRMSALATRVKRIVSTEMKNRWLNSPIVEDTVLYESYSGNGATCSPEALFRYLLIQDDLRHLRHIWVLNDFQRYREIIHEFKNNNNVTFVLYGSLNYFKALCTTKYLINNVTFPTQFVKRSGQVYLNTWHGVPLKKMGYDIVGRAADCKNIVRNFLAADFLLSSSSAMTERMYLGAFKLVNVYEGKIIEEGNPRTDRQFSNLGSPKEIASSLKANGISPDERKIILYAPTWKGESYFSPHNDGSNILAFIKHLESKIDLKEFRVLVKAHQIVANGLSGHDELAPYLVPNSVPTNLVLGWSSMLITDYSSIFYDFLALDRPIIFYIPDLMEYRQYRDLYLKPDELPGPVAETLDDLAILVVEGFKKEALDHSVRSRRVSTKEEFAPHEDGFVCERVIDVVFRKKSLNRKVRNDFQDGRHRILIYAGGMAPNGITTSALNLLDNINYDRFDVTVLCPFSNDLSKQHGHAQINKNARLMFRFGTFNGGYLANLLRLRVLAKGPKTLGARLQFHHRLWDLEWKRCFGMAKFDHMVDFSGYTPFWGTLFLHGPDSKRSIWLHNDLAADAHRSIAGNKPLKDGLYATFGIYKNFDNLVSVSEGLRDINDAALSSWAPSSRFAWASNTINPKKIRRLANGRESKSASGIHSSKKSSNAAKKSDILGRLVRELLDTSTPEQIKSNHFSTKQAREESVWPEYFTYISVGRLSPEKNHARLISAFDIVHREYPLTRLVIAGDGPLKADLESQVRELGLTSSIKLVGHTQNPYELMANSDVFVLSSDYEGQPMVLLEALVLGLPVVTTSFGSVAGALPPGVGTIVDPDANALARAMIIEITKPQVSNTFDSGEYNNKAIAELENILIGY